MRTLLFVVAAVSLAACASILGDDFEVVDGQGASGGSGGQTSVSSGGGTSSTGGSSSTTSGGMGGSGGMAGPCDMYELGACGANKKCTILNVSTGDTGCISTISKPAWSACADDSECIDGTFCSQLYGVCKPLCTDSSQCPSNAPCDDAWLEYNGAVIPGIKLCESDCDPLTQAPCQTPGASCILYVGWDCVRAGSLIHGAYGCSGQENQDFTSDCEAGTYCWGTPNDPTSFHCEQWCTTPGGQSNCPNGSTCYDVGIQHQGNVVGHCVP